MSKVARHLTIKELIADTQLIEQFRQHQATHRVDTVYTDLKASLFDSIHVHQFQVKDRLHMTVVKRVINSNMSQLINLSILEIFLLSNSQHLSTVSSSQELSLTIEQLQGIPLAWIM